MRGKNNFNTNSATCYERASHSKPQCFHLFFKCISLKLRYGLTVSSKWMEMNKVYAMAVSTNERTKKKQKKKDNGIVSIDRWRRLWTRVWCRTTSCRSWRSCSGSACVCSSRTTSTSSCWLCASSSASSIGCHSTDPTVVIGCVFSTFLDVEFFGLTVKLGTHFHRAVNRMLRNDLAHASPGYWCPWVVLLMMKHTSELEA